MVPVNLHEVKYNGSNGREIMENLEEHNAAKIEDAPEFDVSIDPTTGKPIIRVVKDGETVDVVDYEKDLPKTGGSDSNWKVNTDHRHTTTS